MVKTFHAALVFLGVLWLIHDLYALENKSDHETDFYFDEAGSSFNKSFQKENPDIPYNGKLIPQSTWSKEVSHAEDGGEGNTQKQTSNDDLLSDVSTWDVEKLKKLLSLLQSLNKEMSSNRYQGNPGEEAFEMKGNEKRNQLVGTPENNQTDQSEISSLQTVHTDRNPKEYIFTPISSSVDHSKIPPNFASTDFNSLKPETIENQTSEIGVMQQESDSPQEKSSDALSKNTQEINNNKEEPGKISEKEAPPLTYAKSDQERVMSPFDENNPIGMEGSFIPEEMSPVLTDRPHKFSFIDFPDNKSDNSANVLDVNKKAPFGEINNVNSSRPTDGVAKNSATNQPPKENLGTKTYSNLEKYQETPPSKEENNFSPDRQSDVHPQLNSTETFVPGDISFDTENFSNIQQNISTESGKDTNSDSVLKIKESNSKNQLYTEKYSSRANNSKPIQQVDASREDYSSSEDGDSDNGERNAFGDSDDDANINSSDSDNSDGNAYGDSDDDANNNFGDSDNDHGNAYGDYDHDADNNFGDSDNDDENAYGDSGGDANNDFEDSDNDDGNVYGDSDDDDVDKNFVDSDNDDDNDYDDSDDDDNDNGDYDDDVDNNFGDSDNDYGNSDDADKDYGDSNDNDYSKEHTSYDADEGHNISDLLTNATSNATQASRSILEPFTSSSLELSSNSKNNSVSSEFKEPPRKYNSILDYIYSLSNNTYFLSLRN